MNFIQKLTEQSKKKLSNQFIRNLSWLGISEIVYRIIRLGLVVIVAKFLTPYDYGLAAILMTVREYSITFANVGITAKIIQAEEKELEDLCNSAYWLNWTVFGSLFILQCLAAFPISLLYKTQDIILPICVSGLVYLIWPVTSIQRTLIQRENRFKIIAVTDSTQNLITTSLVALCAALGMGVWSFVTPLVLGALIETFMYYRYHPWRISKKFTTKHWGEIFTFGKNILGVNLFRTLRNNLDYLIVGHFIGVKELGVYFFGFNTGLGISLSIINSINSAILPHLCSSRNDWAVFKKRYFSSLKTIALVIIPFVLLQSSLAPFYVPIVFGEKWIAATPILILICLSAIPRPFADAASQLLVAIDKPELDLRWHVIFTGIFTMAVLIGVYWNVIGVAASVLLVHMICLPIFTIWASNYVFPKSKDL
ncbi:lipopolysaccharide biosynthesis protein [Aetokthonos hydrillicola Thurmond2011]|uniref:Lipopolysaccharide biosynthesis protein n=1 Tax=Aetokthonos hydrillicola Thurmond2011 TaxID=2712845 RepID=A0AAP5I5F3_9CYAN|nr:lipopolysaccharide biosynthesis protein [Aetokthonos hydrillicola]MBO3459835.1 lipopolysaccharide biosynthesis protein [Aetokthonos hydrillicola CCALA 1050]MBW4584520.1 lipopolysaccharide biosynthesis protein [Aetokthonos hydrillicola CCALA 1050]MDR9895064.1 lipopolysaccharide biosynthesis protein [Aetokthonos hydrillicola Thurmond2011]